MSYARKDDAVVYHIAARLRSRGVHLWIDKIEILPGDCFRTEITRAIDRCKLLLLMCSEQSLASDFCFKEIAYASTVKRQIVPLWLCPPCPMPGKFALELGPCHQIILANRPVESWLPQLMQSLSKHRVNRFAPTEKDRRREQAPQWRLAIQAACQRGDWQTALDGAQQYLEVVPDDREVLAAAGTASQRLNDEQNQAFSRVSRSRSATDWTGFLVRYPNGPVSDHARRKIAHLLPVHDLERYLRVCLRSAAEDPQATGWRIAAAVCLFRLGNFPQGRATLEEVHAVAPRHAEMLYFRVVAALHGSRAGTLTADRVQAIHQHLKVVMDIAPDCGLPDLLAGVVARDYCEPYQIPCPLGKSRSLLNRASTKGITADDFGDLQALLGMPAPVPVVQVAPQPPAQPVAVQDVGNALDFTNSRPESGFAQPDPILRVSPGRAVAGGSMAPLVITLSVILAIGAVAGGALLIVRQGEKKDQSQTQATGGNLNRNPRVTRENFEKIKAGMTVKAIKDILGEQNNIHEIDTRDTFSWDDFNGTRVKSIVVNVKGGKAEDVRGYSESRVGNQRNTRVTKDWAFADFRASQAARSAHFFRVWTISRRSA